MKKFILAMFCMILIIMSPIALSAEIVKDEDYEEQETGETIAINVRSYEPTILTSNLVEDSNVPIYIFLSGSTLGTLLEPSPNIEPVYGGIQIEKMRVDALNAETDDLILDSTYYKPNKFDVDTLGYIVVTLKQFEPDNFEICSTDSDCDNGFMCETGACIPNELNLDFNADIWFTNAERLYSLSKTALILPVDSDEDKWSESLNKYGAQYSFYGGRGLIRVKDIDSDSVDLTVYSNKDLYWPIIGAPREIQDLTLSKGETSDYIDLGYTDEVVLRNAKFRVMLNEVKDPAQVRANVAVTLKGQRSELVVTEGASLYPGSSWIVTDIPSPVRGRDGYEYSIKLKDSSGNVETITTFYSGGLSEAESDVLAKEFSETRSDSKIYFNTDRKTILSNTVENVDDMFKEFGVDIDTSEVEGDIMRTNKFTIDEGMTLKDVLMAVLPSGYYFNIQENGAIKILTLQLVDPCDSAEIYTTEGLEELEFDDKQKLDNKLKLDMLCTSVSYFQKVIDNYDDEILSDSGKPVVDESYFGIARAYKEIATLDSLSDEEVRGAMQRELEAYQELVNRGSSIVSEVSFQTEVSNLRSYLMGEATYGTASIADHDQHVYVELISVKELDKEDMSSVVLSKDGIQNTYFVGDVLFGSDLKDEKNLEYNWYVYKVNDDSVIVKKIYSSSGKTSTSKTIKLDNSENIESYVIKVQNIISKKEAYITIIPGTGESLHSKSNFSIHIPIEKRAFQLNPDKIDDRIEKAKKLQEKLDSITEKLDKIVRTWNYACLGVFAFISAKMLFFNKGSSKARQDVVHGFDGNSGWGAYCEERSARDCQGTCYNTYDKCMLENSNEIQSDIEAAQAAKETAEELDGDYSEEQWYQDLTNGYGSSLDECQSLVGDQVFLDDESLKNYAYMNNLKEIGGSEQLTESLDKSYAPIEDTSKGDSEFKAKQEACKSVSNSIENNKGEWNDGKLSEEQQQTKKEQIAAAVYDSSYMQTTSGGEIPSMKELPSLNNDYLGNVEIVQVGRVFKGVTSQKFKVYTSTSTDDVTEMNYNDYLAILKDEKDNLDKDGDNKVDNSANDKTFDKILADIELIEGANNKGGYTAKERTASMIADSGARYYLSSDRQTIYVGLASYSTGSLSEKYASDAKIEIFSSGKFKGLPYCLPYKNGNFIKFLSYTTNNEIHTMQVWNVGTDGQLCTADDVLVAHQSELEYDTGDYNYNKLQSFANKYVKMTFYEDERVEINGIDFIVSYGKSKTVMEGASASCYDVMNPNDCKLLFNTCDPVMCPPSRFNLGGRWQVDNVVQTGMIGSLILGQGNGDVVPVCLTGVLASLNYWNSMLDGYVQCLEAAKYEGKSVGICDKVRSVYICELIVREAAGILDSTGQGGGMLDFLASKVLDRKDNSGGEYLKFKENLQSTQDAVSYFTTDYAATMFAAFKGRSTEEIGTTICKQAIYGKMPWLGDMMNQITTPEDPNQFTASLTIKPYAPSLGLSAYQTYYHIYAGNNANIPNIVYSVYLKNSQSGEVYYTTDKCEGVSSTLELTEMADQTIDCVAPEGLDTVCVVMNGETNCGFGSVTTAFSAEFVKDSIVADEAKRQIDSESECYPSAPTASPSVSAIGSLGLTDSLVTPYTYGGLSTGIERVCSLQNPGIGQGNSGSWAAVGTCGTDSEGRLLGTCWINTDSFSIRDADKSEKVSQYLEEVSFANTKASLGIDDLWGDDVSQENYNKYNLQFKSVTSCKDLISMVRMYEDLESRTLSYTYAAASLYQIGLMYYQIGIDQKLGTDKKMCGLVGRKTVTYTGILNSESLGSKDEIEVEEDKSYTVEISFKNIQESETLNIEVDDGEGECIKDSCKATFEIKDSDGNVDVYIYTKDKNDEVVYEKLFKFYTSSVHSTDSEDFEDAYAICGTCGDGLVNDCDVDECHDFSEGCFFDDKVIADECLACQDMALYSPSNACAMLSDDEDRCESRTCYNQFLREEGRSGKCVWNEDKCEYDSSGAAEISSGDLGDFMTYLDDENIESFNRNCICGDYCDEYADALESYASENSIDPLLLLSIMMQESSCSSRIQSVDNPGSSCAGLMQICSFEMCDLDSKNDIAGVDNYNKNIKCGAIILKKYYEKYGDSGANFKACQKADQTYYGWEGAVRAYNGLDNRKNKGNSYCEDQDNYVEYVMDRRDYLEGVYEDKFDFSTSSSSDLEKTFNSVFSGLRIPSKKTPGESLITLDVTEIDVSAKSGVDLQVTPELQEALKDFVENAKSLGFEDEIVLTSGYREGDDGLHGSGNGIDVRTKDSDLKNRLILIRAAIESGFGEIYHGSKDGAVGLNADENNVLKCFWLSEHGDHLHIGLEDNTQNWESCIED